MSDIKVGDLVMVVKADLCGCTSDLGKIYPVEKIINMDGFVIECDDCGGVYETKYEAVSKMNAGKTSFIGNSTECLIKINPPSLEDETEKQIELTV